MATYTKTPAKDLYITDQFATSNFNGLGLKTGVAVGPWIRRMLLHFDLSDFPDYLTIDSANLAFTILLDGILDVAADVYRITQTSWVEGSATWNRYNAISSWATPGGDYDVATPAPVQWFQPRNPGDLVINNLAPHVRDALDNRAAQMHMLCRQSSEGTIAGDYTYRDREFHIGNGTERPLLTVQYTRPTTIPRVIDDPRATIGASPAARPSAARPAAPAARPAAPARSS